MSAWSRIDAELEDTLEAARARRPLPTPAAITPLTRDLVGAPTAPTLGLCRFCGAVAPGATVCDAHSDLIDLDPASCGVVTTNTNGSGRGSLDGISAAGASQEKNR